ncbi:MAG: ATPase domain-containing protein [Methanocellales archaeon]
MRLIHTGIPKLDEYLGGGVPEGKSLLYYVHPGIEGEVFCMQTLYHNLALGKKAVYVTFNSPPKSVRQTFKEFGWDLDRYREKFAIVDAYSMLVGEASNEKYLVQDPENIESVDIAVAEALTELRSNGLIGFGSLSTFMDICGEKKALEYIMKWNKYNFANDNVSIYSFTAWPYSEEILSLVSEKLFDAVVSIGGIVEQVIFRQYYRVLRANWAEIKTRIMLFKVLRPGGVKAYIPKILVTGPYNAGKSSFVQALSSHSVSVDRLGTTIALDHGYVEHKDFSAEIFGTPGQARFDPILKMLGGEAMGVILIVDSTNPVEFLRAKEMLTLSMSHGLPYVVVANKQDLPGALKPEEIRARMKIPLDVPVIPAVAIEKKGVLEAFEKLIEKIMEE